METIDELYASAGHYCELADSTRQRRPFNVLLAKEPTHAGAHYLSGMMPSGADNCRTQWSTS